jgi:mannose-6-phosphate isomerase-like protein (cupin superfamily)
MNGKQAKKTVVAMIYVCFVGGVFVSGCSIHRNHYKDIAMTSKKVLVIELADNPEYQPLLTGPPQTSGMRSGRVYLRPGEDCGQHSTKAHEETLVFLSGKGTSLIGEQQTPFEVGQGRICYIPPYTIHNIKNTGAEPLVYIYCVAPINPDAEKHPLLEGHEH